MVEVQYKWPNDVLFNERKGSGILLESQNRFRRRARLADPGHRRQRAEPSRGYGLPLQPACVSRVLQPDLDEKATLEAFARHFLDLGQSLARGRLRAGPTGPGSSHAKGLNEAIEVRLPNETLSGTFKDLDENGALVFELPDGAIRKIAAGDVHFPAVKG